MVRVTYNGRMDRTQPPSASQRDILSVSQVNGIAKRLLEDHLPLLWVEGEISNFARPSSGHWYFTLKDNKAQIRCAMFKGRNNSINVVPKQGDRVLVRGRISLYEGRGDFQLIAEHLENAGFGNLQRQFDMLKVKLLEQGLFSDSHKKAIPNFPLHVGVITSPTGAAIHDILSVLQRRMPSLPVTIIPTLVQGEGATASLIQALHTAQNSGLFDVLLLARGGGSLEDLWCFNDEALARAIFDCPIPTISAVGHETDFTIADFVADYRAPTPSAAAEVLSQSQEMVQQTLANARQRLQRAMISSLSVKRGQLSHAQALLRHPGDRLQIQMQRLDLLERRFLQSWERLQINARQKETQLRARLIRLHPEQKLQRMQEHLHGALNRLNRSMSHSLLVSKQLQKQTAKRLDTVSPLNTLARGYAIALDSHGSALTQARSVATGDKITVKLSQGELTAQVTDTKCDP